MGNLPPSSLHVQSAAQWPLSAHRVGCLEWRPLVGAGFLPRLRQQLAHVAEAGARVGRLDAVPVGAREQLPDTVHKFKPMLVLFRRVSPR